MKHKQISLPFKLSFLSIIYFFLVLFISILVFIKWGGGEEGFGDNIRENFYTLFKPLNYKSDLIKDYVRISTSTDYNYNTLLFGMAFRPDYIETYRFMTELIKTIIANSPILKFDVMKFNKSKDVCIAIMKNKLNMGIISEPMLIDALTGFNTIFDSKLNFNNLRFVANVGNQYVYLIIRKKAGIKKFDDLRGKKISIGMRNTNVWKVATDMLDFAGLDRNLDLATYEMHHRNALYSIDNEQLDAMFFTDYYPSQFINEVFKMHNFKKQITLLPMDDFKNETFKLAYYYYRPSVIDLNKMPITFLPTETGGDYYSRFKPIFPTFSFKQIIVSNKETDDKSVYNFTKYYYQSVDSFKDSPVLNKNKGDLFQLSVDRSMIFIHRGAYKYYKEMGYVVDKETDPNCKYLVGKTVCDKKSLNVVKHSIIE
jgi:uncharacterized protein